MEQQRDAGERKQIAGDRDNEWLRKSKAVEKEEKVRGQEGA